jgi:hypothetical protein
MIVSINQPGYLPWLGYFDRIARSDLHVVLDHVQFEKNSFTNRNKVRIARGWTWLTIPVATSGRFGDLPISDIAIAENRPWRRKHWATIESSYARAPYFDAHRDYWRDLFAHQWTTLAPLLRETLSYMLGALKLETQLLYSSDMGLTHTKSDLILNICRTVGASRYISGPLGRDYLDAAAFDRESIEIAYHEFRPPVYPQQYDGFEPGMAAIDAVFNVGSDALALCRDAGELTPR